MRFQGSVDIKAPRDQVFAFLVDPDRMGGCLPKVQSIKKLGDGRFEAVAKVGKGLFSASFTLTCEFTERVPSLSIVKRRRLMSRCAIRCRNILTARPIHPLQQAHVRTRRAAVRVQRRRRGRPAQRATARAGNARASLCAPVRADRRRQWRVAHER